MTSKSLKGQLNQLLQYPRRIHPQFVSFLIAYFQIQVKFVIIIIEGYYLWAIHGESQVSKDRALLNLSLA